MYFRVVTSFGADLAEAVDGVFASRVGLHAMEILQGNEMDKSIFPKHPPFTFGFRHSFNFIQFVLGGLPYVGYFKMYLCIFLEKLCLKGKPQDMTRVNDMASLFRFQDTDQASDPAVYQSFRSDVGSFKPFLNLIEEWRKALGKTSFFYLINFSPRLAPGFTTNIHDIGSLEGRYRGAFASPGAPAPDEVWVAQNLVLTRMIIVNNYGKHHHNFTAKPVAFVWDWLELANSHVCSGCITINGVFLSWFRGMPSSHKAVDFAKVLGAPVAKTMQNQSWNGTMRPNKKRPVKDKPTTPLLAAKNNAKLD
jgi:hypothetical protein